MAKYPNITLTNAGLSMIAKSQGSGQLIFTNIKLGDGSLAAGEDIKSLTAVKNSLLTANISNIDTKTAGQTTLTAVISNAAVTSGFFAREMGVYAKVGNDGTEKLYAYTNAGNYADYMPDKTAQINENQIKITLIVGNAANVTAIIDSSIVYTTKKDLDEHNAAADSHAPAFAAHNADQNAHGIFLKKSGDTMSGNIVYDNGTNTFRLTNAYNNLQFVLDNDDITLYDAGKDRYAFTYAQSTNAVQIGNSATAVSIPGAVGVGNINTSGNIVYNNGTNAFRLINAYNNLQFVLDNDDITLYDAGKDRFAFTYSQSKNTVQIGDNNTSVRIPGTIGLSNINISGKISFSNTTAECRWENDYNSTGFVLYKDGISMYDWANSRAVVEYMQSTNTINFGNDVGKNILHGATTANLTDTSTIGGYTAAQLIAASSKVVAVQQAITWNGSLNNSGVVVGTWNPPAGYTREQCVAIAVPSSGGQVDMVYASTETDGRVILRNDNTRTITYEVRVLVVAIK